MELIKRSPLGLVFYESRRIQWMENRIHKGVERQLITPDQADTLLAQTHEKGMQRHIFDMAVAFPLIEAVSLIGYPLLWKLTDGNVGLVVAAAASPLSAGFLPRALYTLGRATQDFISDRSSTSLKSRAVGLLLSPIKIAGSFSLPVQMAGHHPEMARFIAKDAANSATRHLKGLGHRGAKIAEQTTKIGEYLVEKNMKS